jgi:uncharacterized protein (TIGR03435 family)
MVQKLLAERFGFKFNREIREIPVYSLSVSKSGPRLEKSKSDPDALLDQTGNGNDGQQDWRYSNNSMGDFAGFFNLSWKSRLWIRRG